MTDRERIAAAICASLRTPSRCVCLRDTRTPIEAIPACFTALHQADAAIAEMERIRGEGGDALMISLKACQADILDANEALGIERDTARDECTRLRDVLTDIASGRGKCGTCGRDADIASNCTPLDCDRYGCRWDPVDPRELARKILQS